MFLAQGKTCYFGPIPDLLPYFNDLSLPVPAMMNPAEHMLDVTNSDFSGSGTDGQSGLDRVTEGWKASENGQKLHQLTATRTGLADSSGKLTSIAGQRPNTFAQVMTLFHRAFIKSFRDPVTYWIRVVMYLGLAIMMGTVWLRLSTTQEHIQSFINAIVRYSNVRI
jgi:hypothetical protein